MAYIYQNDAWATYEPKKYGVNTTTFTTYPFTIKSPTTPVNAIIYGNMQQTGTPTPTTPIQPQECGDLETEGAKAGQYKIPILNNSQTTNVYLGEVQTTRKIKKLVFDGTENWNKYAQDSSRWLYYLSITKASVKNAICTHCRYSSSIPDYSTVGVQVASSLASLLLNLGEIIGDNTIENFKAYLAQQYANGTPVTVWYVLATSTTGIVNEPLRKIGDYADTVTTSIPVIINSDSVDINTTLKPSAVSVPSLSWGTGDDYKRTSGAWD